MADDNRYESNEAYVMLFPHVVEPAEGRDTTGKPTGKRSYSADFLMSPESKDFIPLRKLVVDIVKDKFPAKYALAVKAAGEKPTYQAVLDAMLELGINTPFKSGTVAADKRRALGKEDAEVQRGQWIFKASKPEKKIDGTILSPPAIGGLEGSRAVDYDTTEKRAMAASKFFFGAEAYFEVSLSAYTAGSGGVKAYLNMVFLNGRGTRMATGGSAAERFGKHVGHVSSINPLAVERFGKHVGHVSSVNPLAVAELS